MISPVLSCTEPGVSEFLRLLRGIVGEGAFLPGLLEDLEAACLSWDIGLFRCFSNQSIQLTPQLAGLRKSQLNVPRQG